MRRLVRSNAIRDVVLGPAGPVLGGLFAAALSALALIVIADAFAGGATHGLDRQILLWLRAPDDAAQPIGPAWLPGAVRDVTALGGNTVLALTTVTMTGYLIVAGRRRTAVVFLGAMVLGVIAIDLMKAGINRPRPDVVTHATTVWTRSFPSSHAAMSAIVYLTLGSMAAALQRERAAKIYIMSMAVALTLLVGASRIYLGVHWPTDVLAGWVFGALWALASLAVLSLNRRG